MNYTEVCAALEEKYQKIQFLRSTANYDEAANNIRKILEMICEYYGDLYHISEFKTERYSLYDKIKFLQKNNRIDKETREAFVGLKHLGNAGSHYNKNEVINQNQLDKALPILRNEIDKFIEKTRPNNLVDTEITLFAFESLSEEGWCGNQNIKTELQVHQPEGDKEFYYEEKVIYVLPNKTAPEFLYNCAIKHKLPLIAWDLDKRIIKQDKNEYFCHANIQVFDVAGDSLRVEGHIIKDNALNEVIAYEIRCKEQVYFHYDKFARRLTGLWCEKKNDIEQSIQILNLGSELSDLQDEKLMLAFHYSLPELSIYKVGDVYCIVDDDYTVAMALSQVGDVIYKKENLSADVVIVAGDIFRVHCLRNCITKYLKADEPLDNWRDISAISLQDGLYTIPFVYDYLWGFQRNEDKATFCLIDTYSDKVFTFDIIGDGGFLPVVSELLSNESIEIDFRALLKKMQEVGCYGLSDSLIENISYETILNIYNSILQDESDEIEARKRALEEEKRQKEIAEQEYKEQQRKIEEQKALEEKKRKAEAKNKKKKIRIGVLVGVFLLGLLASVIILPIVGVFIYNSIPKYVNINNYVTVEMEGYEGIGEAKVVLDYDRLKEDYGDKIEFNDEWYDPSGKTDFDSFLVQCEYSIDGNGQLSNGDDICIVWDINNDDMQTWFNYGVKYENIDYTVTGLEEIDFFDAFDSLTYSIDGVSLDATLSMQNTINIDGYPGLLFTSDKTEGIANNDIITISLVTENGDDLYEYCANRFDAVPLQRELEIVVSELPEYITSYEQISDEELQIIIEEGAQSLCNYYNNELYGKSCEAEYVGNYFLTADSDACSVNNSICVVYHIKRTIYDESSVFGSYAIGTYDFYGVYGINNISVASDGEFIINYDKWYYFEDNMVHSGKFYYVGWENLNAYMDTKVYGYDSVSQIYSESLQELDESYNIQNNMQL